MGAAGKLLDRVKEASTSTSREPVHVLGDPGEVSADPVLPDSDSSRARSVKNNDRNGLKPSDTRVNRRLDGFQALAREATMTVVCAITGPAGLAHLLGIRFLSSERPQERDISTLCQRG